jgi:signal transduction histidine kinase
LPSELRDQVDALHQSRARIAATANGERRDIERDLHDGIQQDLVALAVNLQRAEEVAGSDSAALASLLAEMRRDVRDAIESVRALARRVYPPLLTDLGLAEALRGLASAAGIPVRIDASGDRYPPHIEATVYFACLEALATLAQGGARRAAIHVWRGGESLLFELIVEGWSVADDDSPIASIRTAMNDRVGAAGGTISVVAESRAARVRATIPLPTDPRPGKG